MRCLILVLPVLFIFGCQSPNDELPPRELPRFQPAPHFELIDSSGEPFVFKDQVGKVRIVSFFFSSCPSICPKINDRLAKLIRPYRDSSDIIVISISVDPERDTPTVLTEYGRNYWEKAGLGVDNSKWRFVTAHNPEVAPAELNAQRVSDLLNNGFKLASGMKPDDHNTRVVLVDKEGVIRGFYQGREAQQMRQLGSDLKILLPAG